MNESTASSWTRAAVSSADPGRDDDVRAALVVLGRVVVPLGVRDDLADDGRERRGPDVAEHAALDLGAGDELLHEHLLVVAPGERDGGLELGLVVRLRDPDRRAEPRRLDEDGVAERVLDVVAEPQRHVARDRDAAVAQHRLEQVLVHAERRGGDARRRRRGRRRARAGPGRCRPRRTGPCSTGRTTSTAPSASAGFESASTGSVSAIPPCNRLSLGASSAQRPSRPIAIVVVSYRSGSSAASTERADASEISCSLERPPATTATRNAASAHSSRAAARSGRRRSRPSCPARRRCRPRDPVRARGRRGCRPR